MSSILLLSVGDGSLGLPVRRLSACLPVRRTQTGDAQAGTQTSRSPRMTGYENDLTEGSPTSLSWNNNILFRSILLVISSSRNMQSIPYFYSIYLF